MILYFKDYFGQSRQEIGKKFKPIFRAIIFRFAFHQGSKTSIELICYSWLLYDEVNYNKGAFDRPAFYGWGENYCTNFDDKFTNVVSYLDWIST